jgi:hypothetical protein
MLDLGDDVQVVVVGQTVVGVLRCGQEFARRADWKQSFSWLWAASSAILGGTFGPVEFFR